MWSYVRRNVVAIFRIYTSYEPLRVFGTLATVLAAGAALAWAPFLWDWVVHGDRSGHLQSIILGGVLAMAALQIFALGVLADAIASHRIVSQRTLERVRRIELEIGIPPSHYLPGRPGDGPAGPRSRAGAATGDEPQRDRTARAPAERGS